MDPDDGYGPPADPAAAEAMLLQVNMLYFLFMVIAKHELLKSSWPGN